MIQKLSQVCLQKFWIIKEWKIILIAWFYQFTITEKYIRYSKAFSINKKILTTQILKLKFDITKIFKINKYDTNFLIIIYINWSIWWLKAIRVFLFIEISISNGFFRIYFSNNNFTVMVLDFSIINMEYSIIIHH